MSSVRIWHARNRPILTRARTTRHDNGPLHIEHWTERIVKCAMIGMFVSDYHERNDGVRIGKGVCDRDCRSIRFLGSVFNRFLQITCHWRRRSTARTSAKTIATANNIHICEYDQMCARHSNEKWHIETSRTAARRRMASRCDCGQLHTKFRSIVNIDCPSTKTKKQITKRLRLNRWKECVEHALCRVPTKNAFKREWKK